MFSQARPARRSQFEAALGLSAAFAARLVHDDEREPVLIGVEHEYRVVDETGARVDFRAVIHGLGLGRRHLDPDDPFAYRLLTGNVITCDEAEAEIVLAPIAAGPAAASSAATRAGAERNRLVARLPPGWHVEGHSTHISVSVPTADVETVGLTFLRHFAADLVRVIDSPDRCGLWVRPRPERLELCTDYVDGARLEAAIALAMPAVSLCRLEDQRTATLPPALTVDATMPRERNGWHVRRSSFGGDVFADGDDAALHLAAGGSIPAAAHLAAALAAIEGGRDERSGRVADHATAFGRSLEPRRRGSFEIAPVMVTWQAVVFLVLSRRRWRPASAFAAVPRRALDRFVGLLDRGSLDDVLAAYLHVDESGRRLETIADVARPGLYGRLGPRRQLILPELTVGSRMHPGTLGPAA